MHSEIDSLEDELKEFDLEYQNNNSQLKKQDPKGLYYILSFNIILNLGFNQSLANPPLLKRCSFSDKSTGDRSRQALLQK